MLHLTWSIVQIQVISLFVACLQGRDNSVGHIHACIPALYITGSYVNQQKSWTKAALYKHGPQHDLDLVEDDVLEELDFTKSRSGFSRREDIYSSSEEEEDDGMW